MKGPSLEKQYNQIQEEIRNKIEKYKSSEIYTKFPDTRDEIIESFQKFDVWELDDSIGMFSGALTRWRYGRWEFYKLDKEKFKECKKLDPTKLNCRECQNCGLFDIDGHYSIPCFNIMKIFND